MTSRRTFFTKAGTLTAGAFGINSLYNKLHAKDFENALPFFNETENSEAYWKTIQEAYTVNPEIINLNNGGVSPAPLLVQQALEKYNKQANGGPSYYMWRIMDQGREPLRKRLANLAGTLPEEIAIQRNATEALNTIIYGLPLKKGDEVIGTLQDYPNMIQAWRQRRDRDGIKYKQLSFNFPIENDDEIVAAFKKAITRKTKIVHITHIINWVGQIMPVKKIADMAHAHGAEVIVDGAHSFGLLDFKIPDLNADYFGTSLHKFLSAPIGTGMLWIKKEKIEKIWPLLCNSEPKSHDIKKFETLGTRSFCIEQAIGEAINFHEAIGAKRKEERIRYLKNYWCNKVKDIKGVKLHTSLKNDYSCAIAGLSIEGKTLAEIDTHFFTKYKIHTTSIHWENIDCVRITPHIYTSLEDLDKLVKAITELAK